MNDTKKTRQQLTEELATLRQAEEKKERLLTTEREQRLLAETLGEVFLALTAHTSRDAVLDEILHQLQRVVPHSAANIMLVQGETLSVARWRGYDDFGSETLLSTLKQSLTNFPLDARVVRSRQALIVADTVKDPNWVTVAESAWIRSFMAVPICLQDRVLGLLRLDSDVPNKFSTIDIARLQPLVNAAAIALENARLFDQAHQEIANRLQIEKELRWVAARNQAFLDAIPDSLFYFNQKGQLLGYKTSDMVGVPAGILGRVTLGRNLSDMLPPDLVVLARHCIDRALASKTMQVIEYSLSSPSGEQDFEARFVASGSNEVLAIVRNITQRKRAEKALQESEANLRAIFDNSLQPFILINRDYKILSFNQTARKGMKLVFGKDIKEGDFVDELTPEKYLDEFQRYFDRVLNAESVSVEQKIKIGFINNWFQFNFDPVFANDEVIGVCFSAINIDERKKAVDALAESEARLLAELQSVLVITRALVSQINLNNLLEFIITQAEHLTNADGAIVLLLDDNGQHLEVASPGESWLQLKPGTQFPVKGSLAETAIASQQVQISNQVADNERTASICTLLKPAKIHSLLCAPLMAQDKNLGVLLIWSKREQAFTKHDGRLMGLFADQAALALHNAHLHTQSRQLAVEHERQRLARELHDSVTQSVYSIGLAAETSLKLLSPDAASNVREPIEYIHQLSQTVLAEIREHLYHLHPTVLEEEDLVKALAKYCDKLIREYALPLEFRADLNASLSIEQRAALYYIAREALWNIVKHASPTTYIQVVLEDANNQIVLSIEDDGAGFDPSTTTMEETMGLRGMRERVRLLEGTFEIQSRPGHGTCVIAQIPLILH